MTVAVWIGVMLLGGLGAVARFQLDRAVSKRVAPAVSVRHPRGQSQRGAAARLLRRAGAQPAHRAAWRAPGSSAPTRPSRRGCWRPSDSARSARSSSAFANIAVSVVLGLAAAWLGQTIGAAL